MYCLTGLLSYHSSGHTMEKDSAFYIECPRVIRCDSLYEHKNHPELIIPFDKKHSVFEALFEDQRLYVTYEYLFDNSNPVRAVYLIQEASFTHNPDSFHSLNCQYTDMRGRYNLEFKVHISPELNPKLYNFESQIPDYEDSINAEFPDEIEIPFRTLYNYYIHPASFTPYASYIVNKVSTNYHQFEILLEGESGELAPVILDIGAIKSQNSDYRILIHAVKDSEETARLPSYDLSQLCGLKSRQLLSLPGKLIQISGRLFGDPGQLACNVKDEAGALYLELSDSYRNERFHRQDPDENTIQVPKKYENYIHLLMKIDESKLNKVRKYLSQIVDESRQKEDRQERQGHKEEDYVRFEPPNFDHFTFSSSFHDFPYSPEPLPVEVIQAYRIFGLSPTVDLKEVERQFRSLMRKYHPDSKQGHKSSGNRGKTEKYTAAYKIIKGFVKTGK